MGILNFTPDSFSDGGKIKDIDQAIRVAEAMSTDGADILDIGGESTRPRSVPVPPEIELGRVIPVIEAIHRRVEIPISIDTYKAAVAQEAIIAGAEMVNDVSGLRIDREMALTVAKHNVPICIMHSRDTPSTMQINPYYDDLLAEVRSELSVQIDIAIEAGVPKQNIILDPGFGFSKTYENNLSLLNRLNEIVELGYPVLSGTSRKSMIGITLGGLPVEDRLFGTAATVTLSILRGAKIVRVHDVKAMAQVVCMTDKVISAP